MKWVVRAKDYDNEKFNSSILVTVEPYPEKLRSFVVNKHHRELEQYYNNNNKVNARR